MPAVRSHLDVVETLDSLLMQRASERPDDIFLRFADGEVSFAETDRRVSAVARGLARLGIGRAQLVPVVLPNSAEFVVTWLALCRLGAVAALVNTALRGPALRHALEMTSARQMIVHSSLTPSLQPVVPELSTLRTAVMVGDHVEASVHLPGFDVVPFSVVATNGVDVPETAAHSVTDPRWCCSRRARPVRPRAASFPIGTRYAKPNS